MRIRFEAQVMAGTRWDQTAETFVSYTPALDLYSQGPTEPEALRGLESAIRLYLITAYEKGMLARLLQRHGFKASAGVPAIALQEYIRILEEKEFEHLVSLPAAVDLATA